MEASLQANSATEAWLRRQLEEIARQRDQNLRLDNSIFETCEDIVSEIQSASEFLLKISGGVQVAEDFLSNSTAASGKTAITIHLSKLNLVKFGGNLLEWPTF